MRFIHNVDGNRQKNVTTSRKRKQCHEDTATTDTTEKNKLVNYRHIPTFCNLVRVPVVDRIKRYA